MGKSIYLRITAFDEPNIGVMECDPDKGVDKELLARILEEHFAVECTVKSVKLRSVEEEQKYEAVVDVDEWDQKLKIRLDPTWVYPLNYSWTN